MPCNGEFNPINFKSICYFKQDCCWTSNYIGAWKCFHYKPLKTYSKLNSVKKVFMVFLFTPAAGLYLQCLAYTHLCLFASCQPQTKWTLQSPSVWRNHNLKERIKELPCWPCKALNALLSWQITYMTLNALDHGIIAELLQSSLKLYWS